MIMNKNLIEKITKDKLEGLKKLGYPRYNLGLGIELSNEQDANGTSDIRICICGTEICSMIELGHLIDELNCLYSAIEENTGISC